MSRSETIVAAAAELFAAQGFPGTGIDDIGARAGITGPAIYRHFKGKDALLDAVVQEALDAFTSPDEAATAGLEAMATHAVRTALDKPDLLVTYVKERHRLQGDAKVALHRRERRLFRPWRDAIRAANPDLSPNEIARRHWATCTAMSVVTARSPTVPRQALGRLLVASMVAVLSAPPVPPRSRPRSSRGWSVAPSRRELILEAALRLFRERGFHGVTMDEIGEAVGITGPTIYFHYPSKSEVLADAHERASIRVAVAVQDAVRAATSASDALDRLAGAQLGVAADHRDLIVVTSRETAPLERADRERFVRRAVEIIDLWVQVLSELRPTLADAELRAVVFGVFPLMNQLAHALTEPADGVALVRAWALGGAER